MELYVYESPDGTIADFRPYLDGVDHAFDEPLPLRAGDARWEKIENLFHPVSGQPVTGELRLVGRAEVEWKELMRFPIPWEGDYEPLA